MIRKACSHNPAQVVARQPLFSSLTAEECAALVDRSVCRAVSKGEVLFREGEECRGLYLVVEGSVRVYRANPSGQEQVFGVFNAGDSLSDVALFDDGPYLASARVLEAGRVLFLLFEHVHSLYRTHPDVAHAVVRELGARVRTLTLLADQLSLQDVPTRVAAAVLRYAEQSSALRVGGAFRIPRTQEELAAELGTTREGVARALRSFRTSGAIEQRGPRIEIKDPAHLSRLAAAPGN